MAKKNRADDEDEEKDGSGGKTSDIKKGDSRFSEGGPGISRRHSTRRAVGRQRARNGR